MLSEYTPMTTLATADPARSSAFYEGVLGLVPQESPDGAGVVYPAGASSIMVYPSAFAGTNLATAFSIQVPWEVFDEEVSALRAAGVAFDEFEWDDVEWQDGVAVMDTMKSVWFKDPDGNILNLGAWAQ